MCPLLVHYLVSFVLKRGWDSSTICSYSQYFVRNVRCALKIRWMENTLITIRQLCLWLLLFRCFFYRSWFSFVWLWSDESIDMKPNASLKQRYFVSSHTIIGFSYLFALFVCAISEVSWTVFFWIGGVVVQCRVFVYWYYFLTVK